MIKKIEYWQYESELEQQDSKVPDFKLDIIDACEGNDKLNSGSMNRNLINLIVWVSLRY